MRESFRCAVPYMERYWQVELHYDVISLGRVKVTNFFNSYGFWIVIDGRSFRNLCL
jgi:hypothetical protein